MKVVKVPNYTKILHTCGNCGCEFHIKKKDYISKNFVDGCGDKLFLTVDCPYCRSHVKVITDFEGERQTICNDLQMYLKQLVKKIPSIEDEFTRNELEGFATLIYSRIEKEKTK